jgi:2-C-methyl-D-erythritol 4-phosphate cytidylyltransferase
LKLVNGPDLVIQAVRELRRFTTAQPAVVVVAVVDQIPDLVEALTGLVDADLIIAGGNSAEESLHRGVAQLSRKLSFEPIVVVHDVASALDGSELSARVLKASVDHGGAPAVPVVPMTETVKLLDGDGFIVATVPREHLVRVQLPQAASLSRFARRSLDEGSTGRLNLVGASGDTVLVPGEDRHHVDP